MDCGEKKFRLSCQYSRHVIEFYDCKENMTITAWFDKRDNDHTHTNTKYIYTKHFLMFWSLESIHILTFSNFHQQKTNKNDKWWFDHTGTVFEKHNIFWRCQNICTHTPYVTQFLSRKVIESLEFDQTTTHTYAKTNIFKIQIHGTLMSNHESLFNHPSCKIITYITRNLQ